jgi:hypothetical protein
MPKKALYIYVATAGIGRMGFGSWIAGEKIDRSDGDDDGTYVRLSDALEHAGKRIEEQLLRAPWLGNKLEWGTPTITSKMERGDVHVAVLAFDGFDFRACWHADEANEDRLTFTRGDTPSEALRALGETKETTLAHRAWVQEQSSR